jgi:primosomal protein N' (replication factor Y) (superfamily II helicase)
MSRLVAVVVESDLIQLDRVFDFLVPEDLQEAIAIGQRVSFPLGRTKKLQTGFVVATPDSSDFAKTEIVAIVDIRPVLMPDVYSFSRAVANRQVVAIGEILSTAIPAHMPRVDLESLSVPGDISILPDRVGLDKELTQKSAVLVPPTTVGFGEKLLPGWSLLLAQEAIKTFKTGQSVILIAPEDGDVEVLRQTLEALGASDAVVKLTHEAKKSVRFAQFNRVLDLPHAIVIGVRSAIYVPANNLGFIGLFDDADDSLREQGSPFTHVRELAMMRAGESIKLLFAANYRSVEVQRLIEIGYLSDHDAILRQPQISYTPPGPRFDEAAFKLIRERLDSGPVLILMPRKGNSAAAYCSGCDSKLRCSSCGGPIWEPKAGHLSCRLCLVVHHSCRECGSSKVRLGRTGSSRTVAELGRVFPNVLIAEAAGQKKPSGLKTRNQIVVATPSSAPRLPHGYSAVLILDPDVWLSSQQLRAEQVAIRDWMEAIELMSPNGRAVISGLDSPLGSAISIGQHRELAKTALKELASLGLPPATRICSLEGTPATISEAVASSIEAGAKLLRQDLGDQASALISFSYGAGPKLAQTLRSLAIKTNARLVGTNMRRGLRVVMDDPEAI